MAMDATVWARHANPWSGWSRVASFPATLAALWSVHWIGWYAVLPIAAIAVWALINPRLFAPARTTDNWVTQGVLGEVLWLRRTQHPLPVHQTRMADRLTLLMTLGAAVMLGGLIWAEPVTFVGGAISAFLLKMWFVDRMVWIWTDHVAAGGDPAVGLPLVTDGGG